MDLDMRTIFTIHFNLTCLAWISRVVEDQKLVVLKSGTPQSVLERLRPHFPLRLEARLHDDGLMAGEL